MINSAYTRKTRRCCIARCAGPQAARIGGLPGERVDGCPWDLDGTPREKFPLLTAGRADPRPGRDRPGTGPPGHAGASPARQRGPYRRGPARARRGVEVADKLVVVEDAGADLQQHWRAGAASPNLSRSPPGGSCRGVPPTRRQAARPGPPASRSRLPQNVPLSISARSHCSIRHIAARTSDPQGSGFGWTPLGSSQRSWAARSPWELNALTDAVGCSYRTGAYRWHLPTCREQLPRRRGPRLALRRPLLRSPARLPGRYPGR